MIDRSTAPDGGGGNKPFASDARAPPRGGHRRHVARYTVRAIEER